MPAKNLTEEQRAAKAVYMKTWRAANRQRLNEYRKSYEAANPEVKKKSDKNYYQKIKANPQKLEDLRQYRRSLESQPRHRTRKAEYAKTRAQLPEIKKSHAANARKYYQNKPIEQRRAERAARSDYQRAYRQKNSERLREHYQKWHAANREQQNQKSREAYHRNPLPQIQRARKRMGLLTGTYTNRDIGNLYEMQRGICCGCDSELNGKYEIDHIIPLALDPAGDRLDNLQLLCKPCNRSKHAMHPNEWMKRIGKLFI